MALEDIAAQSTAPTMADLQANETPLDAQEKASNVDSKEAYSTMIALNNTEKQNDLNSQAALNSALKNNTDDNGNIDRPAAIKELAQKDPQGALNLQNQWQNQDAQTQAAQAKWAAQSTAAKANLLKQAAQKNDQLGQLLYSVKQAPDDQKDNAYASARMNAINNLGIDPAQIPVDYDPNFVQQGIDRSASHAQQIAAEKVKVEQAQATKFQADIPDYKRRLEQAQYNPQAKADIIADVMSGMQRGDYSEKDATAFVRATLGATVMSNNPANIPPSAQTTDYWAKGLADGSISDAQFQNGLIGRKDRFGLKAQVYQRAQQIDPTFRPEDAAIGDLMAKNTTNQGQLANIQAAFVNMDKLTALSDQVARSGSPAVNKIMQDTKFQLGDKLVTNFREAQMAEADELGTVLAGSRIMSDFKLRFGDKMANGNLGPDQFKEAMQVAKNFLQSKKNATLATFHGRAQAALGTVDNPYKPATPADAAKLPKGMHFQSPDGVIRIR